MIFNSEGLLKFLTEDDIEAYFILTRRDSYVKIPNGEGKVYELLNLSDEDAKKSINVIRDRFEESVKKYLSK